MNPKVRGALFVLVAVLLAVGVWQVSSRLGPVGSYAPSAAQQILRSSQTDRHAANAAMAVTFDYRGFDTLGEEFMLFATSLGVTIVMREQRRNLGKPQVSERVRQVERELEQVSPVTRIVGTWFAAPVLLFGLYVAAHGHLSPGGGFQAGIVMAAALALLFLGGRRLRGGPVSPVTALELGEALSLLAFCGLGLAGLFVGGAFLENVLPLGELGALLSAGTVPVLSVATSFAVTSALTLLAAELLEQAVLESSDEGSGS